VAEGEGVRRLRRRGVGHVRDSLYGEIFRTQFHLDGLKQQRVKRGDGFESLQPLGVRGGGRSGVYITPLFSRLRIFLMCTAPNTSVVNVC